MVARLAWMALIPGPKAPGDPLTKGTVKGAGTQGVALPRGAPADKTEKAEKTAETDASVVPAAVSAPGADTFVDTPSLLQKRAPQDLPGGAGEGGKGASVRARLQALGVKGAAGLVKSAATDGIRYSSVPGGRILHGSVVVESVRALAKLEGVVRVTGDLTLQESLLKSPDLLVLKTLIEVGGRLTLEGNSALQLVDAFENLERARGVYFGFNPGVTRVHLPKLKEVEAALIFEANSAVTEISLPAFTKAGRYVHVHGNPALTTVLAPAFASAGGELSFVDNPRLFTVRLAGKERPASVSALELKDNGAASYPLLFTRVS